MNSQNDNIIIVPRPIACCCIGSNYIRGTIQFILINILLFIGLTQSKKLNFFTIWAVIEIIFFIGYLAKNRPVMMFHFILLCFGLLGMVLFFIITVLCFAPFVIPSTFMNNDVVGSINDLAYSLIIIVVMLFWLYCYYMYLCWSIMIYAIIKKNVMKTCSAFDTTQGVHQNHKVVADNGTGEYSHLYQNL